MIQPRFADRLLTALRGIVWRLLCLGRRERREHANAPCGFRPDGFIRLQFPLTDERGNTSPADIPWGRRGSLERNGCGTIAVYNLLHGLGLSVTLPALLDSLEREGAPAAGGRLGSSPARLAAYLRSRGCTVARFSCVGRALTAVPEADGLLLLCRHRRGMHYAAALRGTDGRLTVWNDCLCVPSPWSGTAEEYLARLRAAHCVPHELMLVRRTTTDFREK